jgi:hypothetical protein
MKQHYINNKTGDVIALDPVQPPQKPIYIKNFIKGLPDIDITPPIGFNDLKVEEILNNGYVLMTEEEFTKYKDEKSK